MMSVLVGKKAPDFSAAAVSSQGEIIAQFNLYERIKNKPALIFFYPLDFTFVCPSELIALDRRMDAFHSRGIEVIAISIDSQYTHLAWRNTPVDKGGIGPVNYSLVADVNHNVCRAYGVEHPDVGVAFRGAFLIDKQGIVKAQMVNDLPLGRNIDEILRLFDAIQYYEEEGEVCPAGWQKGKSAIKATPAGIASYLSSNVDEL